MYTCMYTTSSRHYNVHTSPTQLSRRSETTDRPSGGRRLHKRQRPRVDRSTRVGYRWSSGDGQAFD